MFRSITVPPIISRMSDRGTRGREEKASLKPANHRERRAPIVRGAITRVDEKKGDHIEEREREKSCHASRLRRDVKQMTPLNLAHSACSLLRAHSSRDTSSRDIRSYTPFPPALLLSFSPP